MKNKKFIALFTLLISVFTFFFIIKPGDQKNNQSPINQQQPQVEKQTALITINKPDGNSTEYPIEIHDGQTAFEALLDLENQGVEVKYEEFDFGRLITSIDNMESTKDCYWTYYINDKTADIGADQYQLSPGDQITWKYTCN